MGTYKAFPLEGKVGPQDPDEGTRMVIRMILFDTFSAVCVFSLTKMAEDGIIRAEILLSEVFLK